MYLPILENLAVLSKKIYKNLLAAAMNPECILKVIRGSGRFLKKVLAALVMVLVSHSIGSSKLSFSDFFLSNPADNSLVTYKQIGKKLMGFNSAQNGHKTKPIVSNSVFTLEDTPTTR